MISHLLYTSNLSGSHSPACVTDIVRRSRVRNLVSEVTGYLMFDGSSFVQWLEGSESAVEQTWHRIRRDPRHEDLAVLHRALTPVPRRFETSMVYALDPDAQARRLREQHGGLELVVALERLLVLLGAVQPILPPHGGQATRG